MALMNRLKAISEEDMAWIHEASLKILGETGVVFHSEEALAICKKHGVKVNGKTVYFPKEIVSQALETSPATYRWQARNDAYSVTVGDKKEKLLLQPNGGPVFIQDLDKGRRPATLEDFANIIKLCQAGDEVSLVGSFPVDPSDVKQAEKHLHMMYTTLKNTAKPVIAFETNGVKAGRVMRICEGMDTSDKEQAVKVIQEMGHQGNYITHPDTLAQFRGRWMPTLSDWETYENWVEAGSEDVTVRANRKYKEILQNAPETLIDPAVDQALNDYIRRAL